MPMGVRQNRRMDRLRRVVIVAHVLVVLGLLPSSALAVPPILTVTTNADTNDGICDSHCSLREAIVAANAAGIAHIVEVAIPGGGVQTITLTSPLPDILVTLHVSGLGQSGAAQNTRPTGAIDAVLRVEIDGNGQSHIFRVTRGTLSLTGLVLNRADTLVHGAPATADPVEVRIANCYLGTTPDGLGAATFGGQAVLDIRDATVTVGGVDPWQRNVIAGAPQGQVGIRLRQGAQATVQGNLIGVDRTGTVALPFSSAGILLGGGSMPATAVIGGAAPEAGNVISGAANPAGTAAGIAFGCPDGCGTSVAAVTGNRIGTTVDGLAPLPNDVGIRVSEAGLVTIGGPDAGDGNIIRFNRGAGIQVESAVATSVAPLPIMGNSISHNGGLGIDLRGLDGPDLNDPGDADAGLQNHPVVTRVTSGGVTIVEGTLSSRPNATYTIEVFANDEPDATGFGEGQFLIGRTTTTSGADGVASWTLTAPLTVLPTQFVTATADNTADGVTSEFSQSSTNLRLAIQAAPPQLLAGDTATYVFTVENVATPGLPAGPVTLTVPVPLGSVVTDAADGVVDAGTITFQLGVLVPGQGVSRVVTLRHLVGGTAHVSGRVSSPQADLFGLDNHASASVLVVPLSELGGTVVDTNGTPVPDVTLSLSGGRTALTTSDASGRWQFVGLAVGTYTVTASRDGLTFSPPQTFVGLVSSHTAIVFTAVSGTYTRYLAEGATGAFFDTQIALFNATATPAAATLTFMRPDGSTRSQSVTIPGPGRRTIEPESIAGLEDTAFSTVIASDQPIIVDRTMTWDDARYGSHAEAAVTAPLTRWFFAEGATTAGFELFYLVQNPNATTATVQVRYLRASGAPLVRTYEVMARSRFNIWVNLEDQALADAEVSADLTSDLPVIVERAMYRDVAGQYFGMGHEGAGVPQASTQWYFAEGATGPFFDLFFLLANPGHEAAQVEATYLKPDGSTVVKGYRVPASSRFNIWVDFEDAALAETPVGTTFRVTSGPAVVAERAMWWGGDVAQWREGHNTAGAVTTGEAWALAEGEVSGAPFFTDTFVLVANTGSASGTVRVTLVFEDGTASVAREFPIAGSARLDVMVSAEFPEAVGKRFGATVESVGAARLPLVVERAMYNRSHGMDFSAGTVALGARLR